MRHAPMDPSERDALLQRYLDGDLPGAEATRLFLAAEEDEELRSRLEGYRALYALLDQDPREEPSPGFDTRVLDHVPYQKYQTAPRRPRPVLILSEAAPAALARLLRPLRNGLTAVGLAWVLFLVVSHSFLQRTVGAAARSVGDQLAAWTASSSEIPLLSGLVGGLARAYDALVGAVASLGQTLGGGPTTVVMGLILGATVWAVFQAGRRRQEAKRTHA